MNCKIIKLDKLSGTEASVYSIVINDSEHSLFEKFILENQSKHKLELNDIIQRLYTIGHHTGARSSFFKHKEGRPADGVVALYDQPEKYLRVYAIRYGADLLILGGGGQKNVRALQDDPKLKKENYLLRALAQGINEKIRDRDIYFSPNRLDILGELEFDLPYYE